MKRVCFTLMALVLAASLTTAVSRGAAADNAPKAKWLQHYKDALDLAKKENKNLFLYFTGSDWCENCIALDKNVFSKPEFAKWANKKFVLVEVDSPHKKVLPDDVKEQNAALQKTYKIASWPTIYILDTDERTLAVKKGFHGEDVAKWTSDLDAELAKQN
jgi:protein disulfide-isomerase